MNVFLPFEGHNVAYQYKGLDQRNIVCEYGVNLLTNEKVITVTVMMLHVGEKVKT